jgi:4-nitrophenyl phosphatase
LEDAAQVTATCRGKPDKYGIDLLVQKHGLDKTQMIMFGDRLDTDIALGINSGISTCCLLTGVTDLSELSQPASVPTFAAPGLHVFVE